MFKGLYNKLLTTGVGGGGNKYFFPCPISNLKSLSPSDFVHIYLRPPVPPLTPILSVNKIMINREIRILLKCSR